MDYTCVAEEGREVECIHITTCFGVNHLTTQSAGILYNIINI